MSRIGIWLRAAQPLAFTLFVPSRARIESNSPMLAAFLCLSTLCAHHASLQTAEREPTLAAKSPIIDVQDGDRFQKGVWLADPSAALDVYVARRALGPKRIRFVSDVASLDFDVEPGCTYDFVIRLENERVCRTRISTLQQSFERVDGGSGAISIPIAIEHDKLHLHGSLDGSGPLDFILDTGAEIHVVYPSALEKGVSLVFDGTTNNVGTGGATLRKTSSDHRLEIGGLRWNRETVLSIEKQADRADGIVSFDLFDGRIVEFDFEHMLLTVHDALPARAANFGRAELSWRGRLPAVDVTLASERASASGPFILDTAGSGALSANRAFAKLHALYGEFERIGSSSSHGVGAGTIENEVVLVPTLTLAGRRVANVPINLERAADGELGAPGGVVCMDLLRRYDLIVDLANGVAYFEPNRFIGEPFEQRGSRVSTVVIGALAAALFIAAGLALRSKRSRRDVSGA